MTLSETLLRSVRKPVAPAGYFHCEVCNEMHPLKEATFWLQGSLICSFAARMALQEGVCVHNVNGELV